MKKQETLTLLLRSIGSQFSERLARNRTESWSGTYQFLTVYFCNVATEITFVSHA